MTDLLDITNVGPEATLLDPQSIQQVISWKKGYPGSGGPFTFLNEADLVVLEFVEGDGLYATPDDGSSGHVGRVLVDDFHSFVGMIVETDVDPGSLADNWALCDGTLGTPDLRDRFVMTAGVNFVEGNTGGASSINVQHTHAPGTFTQPKHQHDPGTFAGPSHRHGPGSYAGPSHRHDGTTLGGPNHHHTGPSHHHTGPSHHHAGTSLTTAAHGHTNGTLHLLDHAHTAGLLAMPNHSHGAGTLLGPLHLHAAGGYSASQSGTTGNNSGNTGVAAGGGSAGSDPHTHSFTVSASVTGNSANSGTGSVTGATATDGTALITGTSNGLGFDPSVVGSMDNASALSISGNTGDDGTGNTGDDGTGITGDSGTGSITGVTGFEGTEGVTGLSDFAGSGAITGTSDLAGDDAITGTSGQTGSATQAILPPYYTLFRVRRIS